MPNTTKPAWTGHDARTWGAPHPLTRDARTWGAPHPLTRAAAFEESERAFVAAAAMYCAVATAPYRYQRSTIQAKRTAMLAAFRTHKHVRTAVLREGPP